MRDFFFASLNYIPKKNGIVMYLCLCLIISILLELVSYLIILSSANVRKKERKVNTKKIIEDKIYQLSKMNKKI